MHEQVKFNHHDSVLFNESIKGLNIKSSGVYVDATVGRGGHTKGILDSIGKSGKVLGLDQDIEAIKYIEEHLNDPRLTLLHCNFSELNRHLDKLKLIGKVNGILVDLGISSPQIDNAERGFSFNKDGALDMRMNQTQTVTAASWLLNQLAAVTVCV